MASNKLPPRLLPALPDTLRCTVDVGMGSVVLLFPNTEANRAKQLGPVPFEMLHQATITVTRGAQ